MKKWWHNSVVYQIYPRSFKDSNHDGNGDIPGIISKLSYLKTLGIDVIWLSPVYSSPMKDNGYDISNYYEINPMFGTMEDMIELLDKAKAMDIKVVMDLVLNHTSDQHYWFQEALKGKDNPYRDYYIWRDQPNNLQSIFGGSAWDYDEHSNQYYLHVFAKEQPDLNWDNPILRQEVNKVINFWLEKGLGGFRLDVIDMIGKDIDHEIVYNGPTLHQRIHEMNLASFGNYDVFTVGETWGATPETAKLYSKPEREELSMIFQFEHQTICWDEQFGKWKTKDYSLVDLKKILSKWQTQLTEQDGWNSLFWSNHDLPRAVSRFGNDKEYRIESAKALAIILHMMKGTPYIYQGEEIGMTNVKFASLEDYNDVEIFGYYHEHVIKDQAMTNEEFMQGVYKNGRDNARTPFQWNTQPYAGFSTHPTWLKVNPNYQTINVENSIDNDNSIFNLYKQLISLRKSSVYSTCIIYGDYTLLAEDDNNIFAYIRENKDYKLAVISNFSVNTVTYNLNRVIKKVVISNYENHEITDSIFILQPYETIVIEVE